MANQSLSRIPSFPSVFEDFFRPFNEIFEGDNWRRINRVPAVNVTEKDNQFELSVAAPGLKKEDFKVDVENNVLTISAEKEENKEEKEDGRITRKEYNYSSFSRSFNLPDQVQQDKIEAVYENGVLRLSLPKKEEARKPVANKQIAVK